MSVKGFRINNKIHKYDYNSLDNKPESGDFLPVPTENDIGKVVAVQEDLSYGLNKVDTGWSVDSVLTNQLAIDNETVETNYDDGSDSYDCNLGKSIMGLIDLTDNPDNIKSLNVTVDGQTYDISNHKYEESEGIFFGCDNPYDGRFEYYPVILIILPRSGVSSWTIVIIGFQTEGPHTITVNIEYENKEYEVSEDFENVVESVVGSSIPQITSDDYNKIVVATKDGYQFSPEPVIFKDENNGSYTCNKEFNYIKNNIDKPWFNLYLFKDENFVDIRITHRYYPVFIDFEYHRGSSTPSGITIRFERRYQGYLRVIDINYNSNGTISATQKQVALTDV